MKIFYHDVNFDSTPLTQHQVRDLTSLRYPSSKHAALLPVHVTSAVGLDTLERRWRIERDGELHVGMLPDLRLWALRSREHSD